MVSPLQFAAPPFDSGTTCATFKCKDNRLKQTIKVLCVGDVIGQSGLRALFQLLPVLKKRLDADVAIVNGENAFEGFGLTPTIIQQIFSCGADVITSGNHIWHEKDVYPVLDDNPFVLRPANYPSGCPGKGSAVFPLKIKGDTIKVGVLNLQGRTRMWPIDCPFKKGKELVRKLKQETPIIIVDMHADAPEEKEALAFHLDGDISAFVGTHTHVQTADERILPKGSAYLTDLGATGPAHSIIGFDFDIGMQRNLSQVPHKNEVSKNPSWLRGACITIDTKSGKAIAIERCAELSEL